MRSMIRCVQLFVTLWTVACQALLFMEFYPGKNTRVGCHSLLQGIFLTQGLNPGLLCLLHGLADSLPLCYLGSPTKVVCTAQVSKARPGAENLMFPLVGRGWCPDCAFFPACSQQGPFLSFHDVIRLLLSLYLALTSYYNHLSLSLLTMS